MRPSSKDLGTNLRKKLGIWDTAVLTSYKSYQRVLSVFTVTRLSKSPSSCMLLFVKTSDSNDGRLSSRCSPILLK